jgi:AbrB family looped-hinge helix DNA binding protein
MATATLTSQGQLTLPKSIRDFMGLKSGDRVAFRVREDNTVVVEPETVDLRSLRGALKPRRKGVTLEQMDEAIHAAATGKPRTRK